MKQIRSIDSDENKVEEYFTLEKYGQENTEEFDMKEENGNNAEISHSAMILKALLKA